MNVTNIVRVSLARTRHDVDNVSSGDKTTSHLRRYSSSLKYN